MSEIPPKYSLAKINQATEKDFVAILGGIFEHAPWVAEKVAAEKVVAGGAVLSRPFATLEELHRAMVAVIEQSPHPVQLGLIRNHPELAGKAAVAGQLTADSTREQKGAGLDQCSPAEFAELTRLNRAYSDKFSMPFVIAVRGLTRSDIIAAMGRRLENDAATEQAEALRQIYKIGRLRLESLIAD